MTDKFIPEVKASEIEKVNKDIQLYGKGFMQNGKHIPFEDVVLYQQPIQTDPKRDEQIDLIQESISDSGVGYPTISLAIALYEKGVRVLSDNQFIATELTDEQIESFAHWKYALNLDEKRSGFIAGAKWAVQRAMRDEHDTN